MKYKFLRQIINMSKYCAYGVVMQVVLAGVLLANTTGHAQQKSINEIYVNMQLENASIGDALKEIEDKTGFQFVYNEKILKKKEKLSFSGNQTLGDLLRDMSQSMKVQFKRIDENIHINTPRKNQSMVEEEYFGRALADILVKGKIVAMESGETLPGVNVLEKGTTNGTITDLDGNYSLTVNEEAILTISYIGYSTIEVPVNGRNTIDIKMAEDVEQLEEVVVIGYGSVKKSDLTGSVSSLKEEDFGKGVNTNIDQMIQGKSAGVQVIQNNAQPGGGVSIRIRGSSSINAGNDPLYVVDGLPLSGGNVVNEDGTRYTGTRAPRNPLNTINPSDIASIEILKDASATAIYGSRGANGVIMITTKKGASGRMKIDYNGYYGVQTVAKKLDMLNPEDYMRVLNDIIADGGGEPGADVTGIEDGGTDWQDALTQSAAVQSHGLSFSGGDESNKYFASLNYFNQEGVVKSSGFQRLSARLNLEHTTKDKFKYGINMTTSFTQDDYVPNGSGINEDAGSIYGAINFDPTLALRDANGDYSISPFISIDNPLALAYGKNANTNNYRTLGSVYGEYFFMPSLSLKLNLGGDIENSRRDVFINELTKDGRAKGGIASVYQGTKSNYVIEGTLNFNKDINDSHSIAAVGGVTTQKFLLDRLSAGVSNFASNATQTYNLGLGDELQNFVGSNRVTNRLMSFFGRVNYSMYNKFLITASMRADGSSRFGQNNKYGYFPSVAVAWKLANEDFISNMGVFSDLKLRTSWGRTGNQEIGNFNSITTFGGGPTAIYEGQPVTTSDPSRIPNPDLKWETTEQVNVGIDYGFLDNRINGSLEFYTKTTSDMLLNVPVPSSTGFGSVLQNVGEIKNTGMDFNISSRNLVGEFEWTTTLNFSTVKNEVIDIGRDEPIISGGLAWASDMAIIQPGQPLFSFYGYEVEGVWQTDDDFNETTDNVSPGSMKYKDQNGDGRVDFEDRVIIGNSFPDFNWGLSNTFNYKGLELFLFLEGVQGIEMYNTNLAESYFPISFRRNKYAELYLNRWTPSNPTNEYPSFVDPTDQGVKAVNTKTLEDASYIRLKTIRLTYNIPSANVSFLRSAQVFVSATNLFTITDYSGYDPASNTNGDANFRIDYNSYPLNKTIMVGLNVGF